MNRTAAAAVALFALAAGTTLLVAGPLNPPAGPVTGTYKTLSEVEPRIAINAVNTPGDADSVFRITQAGSYYLTGNVTGVAGRNGIEIGASGVTIDLGGFEVLGVASSLDGIVTTGSVRNITIHNGSVRNWGGDGIDLSTSLSRVTRVEGVHSTGNGVVGIRAGEGGIVVNCHASYNGQDGISSARTIIGTVARNNVRFGFTVSAGGLAVDSAAFENGDWGIYALNGSTVTRCTAKSNADGIIAFGDALIKECTSSQNTGSGINGQQGTTIIDCVANDNGADGIIVLSQSVVRGNTCNGNVSDGIFVSTSGNNRIEGNHMFGNGRGLNVSGPGNVIVRNTAGANTIVNWAIVTNNIVGPIIDRTAVVSGAISGNSATSSLGSTDANANYTH